MDYNQKAMGTVRECWHLMKISKAVVSHYEEFVSNADLRYSCPPAGDSHRTTVSPLP